jgi:hypothetical protein
MKLREEILVILILKKILDLFLLKVLGYFFEFKVIHGMASKINPRSSSEYCIVDKNSYTKYICLLIILESTRVERTLLYVEHSPIYFLSAFSH